MSSRKERSAWFLQGFFQLSAGGLARTPSRPFNTSKLTFYTSCCFYDPLMPIGWVAWITCAARWHWNLPGFIDSDHHRNLPRVEGLEEGEGVDVGISCQTLSFIGVETEKVVSRSRRLVIPG